MPIPLQDNTYIKAGKPSEAKYFHPTNRPWTDVAEANATLPITERHNELIVDIAGVLYWYAGGVEDINLIPKEDGGGGAGSMTSNANRLTAGGTFEQDESDPNQYNLELSNWLIDFVPQSLAEQSFTIPLAADGLLRFDRPILKNDGTIEIIRGTEAVKPAAPLYDSATAISRELIQVSETNTEVIYQDYFYLLASDNRQKITGRQVINNFIELFARPIPSAQLTYTYIEDSASILRELTFDETFQEYKILLHVNPDFIPIVQVDFTDVSKLNIISNLNKFFIDDLEEDTDTKEFIYHANQLRGGVQNAYNQYPSGFNYNTGLNNRDPYKRADGTFYNWVGGTGIPIPDNATSVLLQINRPGTKTYYILATDDNTVSSTFIVEYDIATKVYSTYEHVGFHPATSIITLGIQKTACIIVGDELYIPCGESTPNKILVFNLTTHVFNEYTISVAPTFKSFDGNQISYTDGTDIWFIGGRGGANDATLPEIDRRCVVKMNIATKVFSKILNISNTYGGYFISGTNIYLVRSPGFTFPNSIERYDTLTNTLNGEVNIGLDGTHGLSNTQEEVPVIAGKAFLFYNIGTTVEKMLVIGNLGGALGTQTFTTVTFPTSVSYGNCTAWDTIYIYRNQGNGNVIRITAADNSYTVYPDLLTRDAVISPTANYSYSSYVNTNNNLLYVSQTTLDGTGKGILWIVDTTTMLLVKKIFTKEYMNLHFGQSDGNRTAALFNFEQPTILEDDIWKSDVNIFSSSPYRFEFADKFGNQPTNINPTGYLDPNYNYESVTFIQDYYENLVERLSGVFASSTVGGAYLRKDISDTVANSWGFSSMGYDDSTGGSSWSATPTLSTLEYRIAEDILPDYTSNSSIRLNSNNVSLHYELYANDFSVVDTTVFEVGQGIINVSSSVTPFQIRGSAYYGATATNNDYVQKKYVDDAIPAGGAFIPLSGTSTPVTGNIQMNSALSIYSGTGLNETKVYWDAGALFLTSSTTTDNAKLRLGSSVGSSYVSMSSSFDLGSGNYKEAEIVTRPDLNAIMVFGNGTPAYTTFKGLVGNTYYGGIADDNAYAQQKFVNDAIAAGGGGGDALVANPLSQFAATTSAQLAGVITNETGSGLLVFNTSPTLVTPLLGTPTSGTLTSCTGLPISTGVSGLGAGVATFLATPSSTNLAAAVTGETGTGALVFNDNPTIIQLVATRTYTGTTSTNRAIDATGTYAPASNTSNGGRVCGVYAKGISDASAFNIVDTAVGLAGSYNWTTYIGTGTLTVGAGGYFLVSNDGAGIITNAAGVKIATVANNGAGTITNSYGLLVEDIDEGTNNWAIRTKNGVVQLDDNVALFGTGSFGGGSKVLFMENRTTAPSTNPVGGAILYAESGAIKGRGSSGTVTTMAAADPHCPVCGSDFVVEYENEKYGYFTMCMSCLGASLGEVPFLTRQKGKWHTHKH